MIRRREWFGDIGVSFQVNSAYYLTNTQFYVSFNLSYRPTEQTLG